ncbi:MAG: ADP-ribosylglycohydrolase family protein [Aestuariivirga sp.]
MNPIGFHLDKARGALLGLAVGDALGTTLEFRAKDSYEPLTGMVGGGPFGLEPGEWTDDTSMALALADSLLSCGTLDPHDLSTRFCRWRYEGEYSHNGRCFDVGNTVSTSLKAFERTGDPLSGSTDPDSAGNGSLMRLAPVALFRAHDLEACIDMARLQSRTTHGAEEAVSSCTAFALLLYHAIRGGSQGQVLTPRSGPWSDKVSRVMAMETISWSRSRVRGSGYVIHSLEAAIWAVGNSNTFREAVLLAVNLGEDADTTAAITGQLAGAIWGASAIPDEWLNKLAWREQIISYADKLHESDLAQSRKVPDVSIRN